MDREFTLYLLPSQLHVYLAYHFKIQRLVHQEMSKWSISCQRLNNVYEVRGVQRKYMSIGNILGSVLILCGQHIGSQPSISLGKKLYNYSLEVLAKEKCLQMLTSGSALMKWSGLGQIYNKTIALDRLMPETKKPKKTTLNRELEL